MKTKLIPFDIEKAKNGAKVVTRYGLPVKIVDYPIKNEDCPILGIVLIDGKEFLMLFAKTGNQYNDSESCYDLSIEEEVEEDDSDYDPYKATVESIADMVERYASAGSDLQDFYDNVKVQCKDAVEYERIWCKKQGEQKPSDNLEIIPDKWYTCIESWNTIDMKIGDWFEEDHYYLGSDILKYKGLLEKDEDFKDYFHPWNISDVKNGDVLMKGEVIFIFNKMLGEWIYCHSSISYKDSSSINLNNCGLINNEVYPATKEQRDFLFQKMKEAGYEWDEKKKELKKIENEEKKELKKIEPKFQKGDWVVFKQDGNAHQIIRVVENVTNHTYGYDTADDYYFNDTEESVRCWTIQEAKNGDVLRSTGLHNDCIFIFNGLDNWKFDADGDRAVATGYCCLDITADKMEFGIQGPDCIEVNTIKPATKEQRDFLFQKIKEAGYEWDSERKELKNIKYKDDMAEKEVKQKSSFNEFGFRRMTNQELSWWLRDHPEEHRECRFETASFECEIFTDYPYLDSAKDCEVPDKYYIRKNGREWQEPLVEI